MKKLLLIIEDDFEVMGNGLGNVAYHQYLPANFLMNLCEDIGIKMSFMVDVAHILELKKFLDQSSDIKLQVSLWEETVKQMASRGFDVQLHLHPQWLNATYKEPFFYLGDNWNIGRYKHYEQEFLIKNSVEYLTDLITPINKDYKLSTFKAGSWGLQPSENLLTLFDTYGFKLICGLRMDMHISSAGVDYRGLEEETLPYYPDYKDIRKVGKKGNIRIIPLAYYSPDIISLSRLFYHLNVKLPKNQNHNIFYKKPIPIEIASLNGVKGKKIFNFGLHPYLTHLKFSNEPFSYLKKSFDTVHKRFSKLEGNGIPIIFESHTKHYMGNYNNISKFLKYIVDEYNETIEFITFSDYLKNYLSKTEVVSNEDI